MSQCLSDLGLYWRNIIYYKNFERFDLFLLVSWWISLMCLQISAPVGSTVVLPCDWSHLSIKTPYVQWFIGSETVFDRKGKEINQSERYEGRVDVPEDELLKGNCSLVMKNISVNDTGIYSTSMIKDIQESVLVQKVKLSVVGNVLLSLRKSANTPQESSRYHVPPLYFHLMGLCLCGVESLVTVSAPVGSTVILPCKLTEEFKQSSVIKWKINNKLVFERNSDGPYSGKGYEGRVDVPVDELRKGNCSLVMKNVSFTDDQTFTMEHVDTEELKEMNRVYLSVYALQISAPVGSTVVLPCDWSHLSIKTPHVQWFIGSETVFDQKGKEINQSERYEGRVDVPEDELLKGNCSLVMKNISVNDTGIYSSSMLITDTHEPVLVQKVKLSVVEDSVNERGSSSEDSDSDQTGGNNWIIICVVIVIFIIIISVSVYYSRVKENHHLSSGLRRATNSTEQNENVHHNTELYNLRPRKSPKKNKESAVDTQPQS
ncbi:hypothetical protein Q7C36_014746 [Tachysurus vachellii]|uniref:Ig-like domain-containing protein n=1 Tax=Tachysurus vachellii TaxID=175792 RepID=A0AA88SI01_TACVA|nr:hypothetical protein Q7C36_014746 [Tachysurus vachellii]